MNRNQTLAITLCSLACLGYSTRSANAGWFDPSNYEECVLENMKGQGRYMFPTAREACLLKFPDPEAKPTKQEVVLKNRFIHFNWCVWDETNKEICILDQPDRYTITKVIASFSAKEPCIKIQGFFDWSKRAPVLEGENYFAQFDPPAGPPTPAKPGSGNSIEDEKNWITITGEKAYFSQTYSFKIPPGKPGNLNCVDVSFRGFIK